MRVALGISSLCAGLLWAAPAHAWITAGANPVSATAGPSSPATPAQAAPSASAAADSAAAAPLAPPARPVAESAPNGATRGIGAPTATPEGPAAADNAIAPASARTAEPHPARAATAASEGAADANVHDSARPYTGWRQGERAPVYFNLLLSVGTYGEDANNRLTTRDIKTLEGVSGIVRVGAVLDRHRRIGARMSSFVRPTKKVALDPATTGVPAEAPSDQWGAVTFGYFGPEFLYTTDLGFYGGASLGVGAAMSTTDMDHKSRNGKDYERASAGVAGVLSLGYEWRFNKWFSANAEAYGGLYRGLGDDEKSMNGSILGMGMGVGF